MGEPDADPGASDVLPADLAAAIAHLLRNRTFGMTADQAQQAAGLAVDMGERVRMLFEAIAFAPPPGSREPHHTRAIDEAQADLAIAFGAIFGALV